MRINSINNYNYSAPKRNSIKQATKNSSSDYVNFTSNEGQKSSSLSKAAKGTVVGLLLFPAASGVLSSCNEPYVHAEAHAWVEGDTTTHHGDTVIYRWEYTDTINKWKDDFERPEPLDSIFNNLNNWDIDGADGDINDPNSKRNITHYEGIREWEYMTRESGDINYTDFPNNKKILVYDTEIKDWRGNHLSYGKQIIRIPQSPFTLTDENGKVLNSPKGFFVESWTNNSDIKGASIADCTPVSRVFCQTQGDTLKVAKVIDANNFGAKGFVTKGYLGDNTILLRNLIGENETDDHITDFKVEAVDDKTLKDNYIRARYDATFGK